MLRVEELGLETCGKRWANATVYFLCDHILGTQQLITLASFHCFGFQGP